jgi:hypothetical protein
MFGSKGEEGNKSCRKFHNVLSPQNIAGIIKSEEIISSECRARMEKMRHSYFIMKGKVFKE